MNSETVHIDAHWRSINKDQEELCGDKVAVCRNDQCFVMVLADGLGSGVKANILSTLTSTIISKMLSAGMQLNEAIETIAATLPECKERGIAYSTFSIFQVYYDGSAYLAQFDNPSMVIIRDGAFLHPLQQVREMYGRRVSISTFLIEPGDFLIAFSDGVLHAGIGMTLNFGWGQKEVEEFLISHVRKQDSSRDVTRVLLSNVNYLYGGHPGDDATVACVKIIEAKETRVMVGPPSHSEQDAAVVGRLLSASGMKICCGGTTSQIVARVTDRPLETDGLLSMANDVPPKGFIKGIDLVTEGVLTLQKTNRYLQKACEDPVYEETLRSSKEQDGASCLVRALLNSSSIAFMVGLSDNPAHDAIAYSPISLNAKIALIKEMGENLKQLGKIIHIEMY